MKKITLPKKLFPFYIHFLKQFKGLIFTIFVFQTVYLICSILPNYFLKNIINSFANLPAGGAVENLIFSTPVVLFLAISAIPSFTHMVQGFLQAKLFPLFTAQIEKEMFEYFSNYEPEFFEKNKSGAVAQKIIKMSETMKSILHNFIHVIYSVIFNIMFFFGLLFFINKTIAFIILGWSIFYILISTYLAVKRINLSNILAQKLHDTAGYFVDVFTNFRTVKSFNKGQSEKRALYKVLENQAKQSFATGAQGEKDNIIRRFLSIFILIFCTILSVSLFQKGLLTIGDFAFILPTIWKLNSDVFRFTSEIISITNNIGFQRNSMELLKAERLVKDDYKFKNPKFKIFDINFKNVNFKYKKGKNVLKNLSFNVRNNENVGVVGLSGSGKSTISNLLQRFYDVDSGEILIDKYNIKDISLNCLNSIISYIPQEGMLFHRTILENIKYGCPTVSNKKLKEICKKCFVDEFVSKLPDGYNTIVGERGSMLSGGQRQRIIIARAILKNSPIIIMDESTSALDSEVEKSIQVNLDELTKDKTTIVIAHRLSTLKQMDRIIVLDKGKIVEEGTHKQLLKKQGLYAKMWKIQSEQ